MKSWGRFFRRLSTSNQALKEDYPTHSDSDITDDETLQREWENHLKRRSTLASAAATNLDTDLNNWDVQSEYNLQFPSDDSFIESYHDGKYDYHDREDGEFENVLKNAVCYERKRSEDKQGGGIGPARYSLHPSDAERDRKPRSSSQQNSPRSPKVCERIRDLEQSMVGKRRASTAPQASQMEKQNDRRSTYDRYATWNNLGSKTKRKVMKNSKNRKRATQLDLSLDETDDESKYTVNLTMEDLNSIIKKNINSAVKTIISATTKADKSSLRPISPTDSFSTETETIFSGSSSQSTELQPGVLHKQISWQLDSDRLKGGRRKSQAGVHIAQNTDINPDARHHSMVPTHFPRINEVPTSLFPSPRQEHDQAYLQQSHQYQQVLPQPSQVPVPPPPPPPPPIPQPATQPQVTFNLTPQQPAGFHGIPNQMQFHQSPDFQARALANARPSIDFGDPFSPTMADISNFAAGNRYRRRHTLASLDPGDLFSSTENALDAKVEQLNNVLTLLDKNISKSTSETKLPENTDNKDPQPSSSTSEQGTSSQNVGTTAVLTPILSIADQIAALSKKKKKPLEPGQIRMSSCARAILVLTNIAFIVIGGGAAGLGVWLMMDPNIENYFAMLNVDQTSQDFKSICYALIGIGAFILTIAFTGCCGTMKSSRCLLTAFLVMISVIAVAETGLGVLVFLHLDSPAAIPVLSAIFSDIEDNLRRTLKRSIIEKYDPNTMIGTTWNLVQIQTSMKTKNILFISLSVLTSNTKKSIFYLLSTAWDMMTLECCGATGPDDYKLSKWKNDTANELTIPDECCVLLAKDAEVPEPTNKLLCQLGTVGFFHGTGCFEVMKTWFKTNSKYILAAGISSIVVEVFAFISAVVICQKGKKDINKSKDDRQ